MYIKSAKTKSVVKGLSILMILCTVIISCGSTKNISKSKNSAKTTSKSENLRNLESDFDGRLSGSMKSILKDAERYLGAPYKFAGNSSDGFDCSGLTAKVFNENGLKLPRRSADQANAGKNIDVKEAKPGDLLFFATAGGNKVSHVGIVYSIESNGEIKFIHSSTSKGVIISSLNEKYWNKAYLHTQRVL
ncbi:C40 family peptidase [Chryseobacterium chendengshani]|uniref:C40 family peptidase n=1 Tax=Chryseobacterium sp. LJ756 TaxID=2864113 RepID=UPI001C63BA4A|nr:C40 family peptidase [Chryseobacterium sp. LJ756]MBW7674499.1 C40 family peptidase [Chryseobacterium sp. LJ756]